jgi:hypothetical protein
VGATAAAATPSGARSSAPHPPQTSLSPLLRARLSLPRRLSPSPPRGKPLPPLSSPLPSLPRPWRCPAWLPPPGLGLVLASMRPILARPGPGALQRPPLPLPRARPGDAASFASARDHGARPGVAVPARPWRGSLLSVPSTSTSCPPPRCSPAPARLPPARLARPCSRRGAPCPPRPVLPLHSLAQRGQGGLAPCACGHGMLMAQPSPCARSRPQRGVVAPTQRGPDPAWLRLAWPRCPYVARPPARGSFTARQRGLARRVAPYRVRDVPVYPPCILCALIMLFMLIKRNSTQKLITLVISCS